MKSVGGLLIGLCLMSCGLLKKDVKLYRTPVLGTGKTHVATFNVNSSVAEYNEKNCKIAAKLFQNQPGVTVKYWCDY